MGLSIPVRHYVRSKKNGDGMRRIGIAAAVTLLAAGMFTAVAGEPDSASWAGWGNTLRFDRYSPADQINAANVAGLKPVWIYELAQKGGWQITPIVAGGILYAQDLEGDAFALDPETGHEIWRFASGQRGKMRAVSYWPGDAGHAPRIVMAANDRIYALDAATGKPVAGFGDAQGYIDIRRGFARPGQPYRLSSPPTIYRNLIIAGPATQEFGSNGPPGDPRAYDVITGRLVWRFHIVPRPGERNAGTWGKDGWRDRSGPGTWGMMSVDAKTGLVFIPVAQPADNYVGIDRPGDDLYSDSVLALDAATGKYRWHFQMVHHDLWDYDVAAPPALIDLTIKGRKVPALVEVTKQGLMFILDRRTGKPVFGVEERPVPQSTIPGEKTSATQPFPLKPPPLAKLGVFRSDISTITPEVQRFCTDMWNRMGFRDTPLFTPPSLTAPNLFTPSNIGGLGGVWGGVSIDPGTATIFTTVNNLVGYNRIVPDDGKGSGPSSSGYRTEQGFSKWMDQNGTPCIQPPWGEIVAVNGNTGDVLWRAPLGAAEIYGEIGAHTGMINLGGTLATAGGLVFVGATSMSYGQSKFDDPVLRAFDRRTGIELWRGRLPAGANSAPMTFIGKSGRQYVVVAASGRPDGRAALVAFALSRAGDPPLDIRPAPQQQAVQGSAAVVPSSAIGNVADLPPGPGREDVATVCTACHSIGTVTGSRRDAAGWTATVEEMRGRGAKLDDAAASRVAGYLLAHFNDR